MPLDSAPLSGTVYIPDTSSLVENPDSLDRLLTDGNVVVLLHQVIEELGRLQASRNKSEGVRAAARSVMRNILTLRGQGLISHDIRELFQAGAHATPDLNAKRGTLAWEPEGDTMAPYDATTGDNLIVAGARRVAAVADECAPGRYSVVVVSEDSNVLLKCDAVGLRGEALRFGKLELDSPKEVYRGYIRAEVEPSVMRDFLDGAPPMERSIALDTLDPAITERLMWNTGVILQSGDDELLLRADLETRELHELRFALYWDRKRLTYSPRPILGMTPRDPLQCFAMEFMLDPAVQLVVLDGPAGSGKTRLMMAAALHQLLGQPTAMRFSRNSALAHTNRFENGMFLLRPEHPSSNYELGYLPGDFNEKVSPWLEPFMQHMRALSAINEHDFMAELEHRKMMHMLSTSLLRGLDIESSIVLVDELQNGDRHLAKTLMSRFCETSKVVLAGCLDPVQIDNPYVDWRSNALTRVKQTYKGFGPVVAQISLENNYRGPISKKADEL
ncbi:MAG: PhoH family protein [Nannocystales bacterium]